MRSFLTVAVIYLTLAVSVARADVVYSNFGPGDTFETVAYVISGPDNPYFGSFIRAVAFTPSQGYLLDSVDVVLRNHQDGPRSYDVIISEDAGGEPGSSLEQVTIAVPDTRAFLTATFAQTSVLRANEQYWLWVTPRGVADGVWHFNAINDTQGMVISSNEGTSWTPVDPVRRPVFRVSGTPVPEPTSVMYCITAFGILLPRSVRTTSLGRR